ncbi:TatD DNase family protein [Elusimicrobium posterum]|uniref:TatD family hydrolase n=1 Tax=Elusimicrobium posterum TaxID=3116653 RepID=UPI003C764008
MELHLIDSHAHMTDSAFDADRAEVLQNCFDANVKNIIEIGCNIDEWQPVLDLTHKYDGKIFAVLGLHPSYLNNFSAKALDDLKEHLKNPKALGLGEIGLDYVHIAVPEEEQKNHFKQLLLLTKDNPKPIVLHARRKESVAGDYGVYDDMFRILEEYWTPKKGSEGVLHCFSGRYQDALAAVDMGLKLGINGIITYKKNDDLRETVKKVGLKNILLETDCPYLPPQIVRGQRNSPVYIPTIATYVADVLGISLEEVAEVTTQNCRETFNHNF